jgi:hypothetical protein
MSIHGTEFVEDMKSGLLSPGVLELSGAIIPNDVTSDGTWLTIEPGNHEDPSSRPPSPPTGMLDAFVRIASGSSVQSYVSQWGALGFCKHGYPAEHNGPTKDQLHHWGEESDRLPQGLKYQAFPRNHRTHCVPEWMTEDRQNYMEPVERYIYFASQALSMLRLASELHADKTGSDEDWSRISEIPVAEKAEAPDPQLDEFGGIRWLILNGAINEWADLGSAKPVVFWNGNAPQLRLSAGPFGTLGMQLIIAATRSHGLVTCSECRVPYVRQKRMPKQGQRNYCPSCGDPARWRSSKRNK